MRSEGTGGLSGPFGGGPNNAILLVCIRPYLSIKKRENLLPRVGNFGEVLYSCAVRAANIDD